MPEDCFLAETITQTPSNLVDIAHDTLHDVAFEPIDLFLTRELAWAVAHDFARLQVTMEVQISHTTFSLVRQQIADGFPQLTLVIAILNLRFIGMARLWQGL